MHTPPKKLHWYTLAKGDEYRNPSANSCGPFMTWADLPERGVTQSVTYVPEPQWLPIETAPRDGTRIDIFTVHGDRIPDCYYDKEDDLWRWKNDYHMPRAEEEVTHWMPLPEAPKC
jgi:hypothetical protein